MPESRGKPLLQDILVGPLTYTLLSFSLDLIPSFLPLFCCIPRSRSPLDARVHFCHCWPDLRANRDKNTGGKDKENILLDLRHEKEIYLRKCARMRDFEGGEGDQSDVRVDDFATQVSFALNHHP